MKRTWLLLFLIMLLGGCTSSSTDQNKEINEPTDELPVIYVSNYPLEYFVQRIAGPVAEVRFPASISSDPAYWEPTAEDITQMQAGELIVLNGASYEQWLANVSLPASKIVETAKGFEKDWIKLEDNISHSHGLEGEHEHGGIAFTTWLDIKLAAEQARSLKNALVARIPEHASHFEDNYAKLEKELVGIDSELRATIGMAADTAIIFSHPVYQYFERGYGVHGVSVHWEPDEVPDESMLGELRSLQSEHKTKWMVWEGEPLDETVRLLKAIGIQSAVVDPCGNRPDGGDFTEVMKKNISELHRIYGTND